MAKATEQGSAVQRTHDSIASDFDGKSRLRRGFSIPQTALPILFIPLD